MKIGERIKELRKEQGLTQEALAKMLGIARPTLCHYEKGNLQVPNDLLPKLATTLKCDINYLFAFGE